MGAVNMQTSQELSEVMNGLVTTVTPVIKVLVENTKIILS